MTPAPSAALESSLPRLSPYALFNRGAALVAVGMVLLAQILAPAGSEAAPIHLIMRFFSFPAGWSLTLFVMIVGSRAERMRLLGVLAIAALIGALAGALPGVSGFLATALPDASAAGDALTAVGIAAYAFVGRQIAMNAGAERARWIDILCVGSLIHVTALGIPFFRDNTAVAAPGILDLKLASIDESFGFQPSSAMAWLLTALPGLKTLAMAAYALAQPPIVIVAAFYWKRPSTKGISVIQTFMIASTIGFTCYYLTPAIGPVNYFTDSPMHVSAAYLSHLPLFDFHPRHPRNAMPSMHMTWAILVFLYARGFSSTGRLLAGAFMFLTLCATLGLREHYLIDLIVALAVVLFVRSLCAFQLSWTDPDRLRGMLAGIAMLALWISLIRCGPAMSGPFVVVLALLTSTIAVFLEDALARAEARRRLGLGAAAKGLPANAWAGGAKAARAEQSGQSTDEGLSSDLQNAQI
jgi:hypothetical protein